MLLSFWLFPFITLKVELEDISKIIFIHGVGEGVLKDRLHDVLKSHAQVKHFNNNWQQQFGFGATEIFLK